MATIAAETCTAIVANYRRGTQELTLAKSTFDSFKTRSKEWIAARSVTDQAPTRDRLETLTGILAELEAKAQQLSTRVAALNKAREATMLEERAALTKTTLDTDQKPLISHLAAYPDAAAHFTETIDAIGAAAEKACLKDGVLDLSTLDDLAPVESWGTFLTGDGSAVKGAGADTLRWLWAARQWYAGTKLSSKYAFLKEAPQIRESTPHAEWRSLLAMQYQMGQDFDKVFERARDPAVYRQMQADGNRENWYFEVIKTGEKDTEGHIERSRANEDGTLSKPVKIPVSIRNDTIYYGDIPALEVRGVSQNLKVAHGRPQLVTRLPDASWTKALKRNNYLKKVQGGLPCVVVTAGTSSFWFSPGIGLVRHEVKGAFARELCHSERLR